MKDTHLLVVCHGTKSPGAEGQAREFCRRLEAAGEWAGVGLAWIQFVEPDVAGALNALGVAGAKRIVVAPILSLPGRHLDRDLPETLENFNKEFPNCEVAVTESLLTMPGFEDLLNEACRRARGRLPD